MRRTHYRRNPESVTVASLREMASGAGMDELVEMLADDEFATIAVTMINSALAEGAAKRAAAAAAEAERAAETERARVAASSRDLTDREGWSMSAALFTAENFPTLSEEERSALRAAFLEEAEKAAA